MVPHPQYLQLHGEVLVILQSGEVGPDDGDHNVNSTGLI